MPGAIDLVMHTNTPIPTWFGVGGRADRLCTVQSVDDVVRCLQIDPTLRILGEGANLLVEDEGVGELVLSMDTPEMRGFEIDASCIIAMAGAPLAKIVTASVRAGLAGLEGLGGIPASIGGAAVMNAGGAFGEIGPLIERIHAVDRSGNAVTLERADLRFEYRTSGLTDLIVTRVELALTPADPAPLRARLKAVMERKKHTQPMADRSAGCAFRNPRLPHAIEDIGAAGERVGAGLLIDRAGCKGMHVRGASVSDRHANFITVARRARAADVIELMDRVCARVNDCFGVTLEREVVVWRRSQ